MSTSNGSFRSMGPYLILEKLGSGSFASVYRCKHTLTRHQYAGKLYDVDFAISNNGYRMVRREVSILKLLRGPRVIRFHEALYTGDGVLVVMELVEGRTLLDIMPPTGGVPESFARSIFSQILEALLFLHSNGIVHRDLKLENIMIQQDGNIKVIDFGLADYVPQSARRSGLMIKDRCGSPHYYAPEMILAADRERFQGDKADIWAIGVILYSLVNGFHPFYAEDGNDRTLYRQITKVQITYDTDFSRELEHLLKQIFVKDPNVRVSLRELQIHAWTNNTILGGSADAWLERNAPTSSSTGSNLLGAWPLLSSQRQMMKSSDEEESLSSETCDEIKENQSPCSDGITSTGAVILEEEIKLNAEQETGYTPTTAISVKEEGTNIRRAVGRKYSTTSDRRLRKICWHGLKACFKGLLRKKEGSDSEEVARMDITTESSIVDENRPPEKAGKGRASRNSLGDFDFERRYDNVEASARNSGPYCKISLVCWGKA